MGQTRNKQNTNFEDELFTFRNGARALDVAESTLRFWAAIGKVAKVRLGSRCVRIPRSELLRLIREGFRPAKGARPVQ
jgi:hypothetical protein